MGHETKGRESFLRRAGELQYGTRLRVLGRQSTTEALRDALHAALQRHGQDLHPLHAARIRRDVVEAFASLSRAGGRTVRGVSKSEFLRKLDRARHNALVERDLACGELRELEAKSQRLREALADHPDKLPAETERQLDAGFEAVVREAFEARARSADGSVAGELHELQECCVRAVLERARVERHDLVREQLAGYESQIEKLQRRLAKLKKSLEQTEEVLAQVVQAKHVDEIGLSSIYRDVQGLSPYDELYAYKQEMLRDIFEANVELRCAVA